MLKDMRRDYWIAHRESNKIAASSKRSGTEAIESWFTRICIYNLQRAEIGGTMGQDYSERRSHLTFVVEGMS